MVETFQHRDYSKWERSLTNRSTINPRKPEKALANVKDHDWQAYALYPSRVGSSCSLSKCRHPWNNYRDVEAANADAELIKARIKEIKVKIKLHEKSLFELKQHESSLLLRNLDLFCEIQNFDKQSFGKVGSYLDQYDRSKDGLMKVQERFVREKESLEEELKVTKANINFDLSALQKEVDRVTEEVTNIFEELALLNNYKDKIYPERLLLIHNLKQKIQNIKLSNESFASFCKGGILNNPNLMQLDGFGEHEAELLDIIQMEHSKLVEQSQRQLAVMKSNMAEHAMTEVDPLIVNMSRENKKLRNDIAFHKDQIKIMKCDVTRLEESIHEMQLDPNASITKSMFPQIYRHRSLCNPDDDIQLDIPVRKFPVI